MIDLSEYSPAQALAHGLILTALTGGSNHWARVHGRSIDCPPEQVRVEGVDLDERRVWTVDLDDVDRAISKLIATPYQCAASGSGVDPGLLRTISETPRRRPHAAPEPSRRASTKPGRAGRLRPSRIRGNGRRRRLSGGHHRPGDPLIGTRVAARDPARAGRAADHHRAALHALVAAYRGNTYRLLRELGDHLGASIAYIDRDTIDAHLERRLSDTEWAIVNDQFSGLDFDDHIGDQGRFRTDWIETILAKAGVSGHGYTADGQPTIVHRHSSPRTAPQASGTARRRTTMTARARPGREIGW